MRTRYSGSVQLVREQGRTGSGLADVVSAERKELRCSRTSRCPSYFTLENSIIRLISEGLGVSDGENRVFCVFQYRELTCLCFGARGLD
jgi:hypothetical protein